MVPSIRPRSTEMSLLASLSHIIRHLNSDSVVASSGFMLGFVHEFKFNKKTLDAPLSAMFSASISGFVTSIGASIVGTLTPHPYRALIPVAALVSCAYHKHQDLGE